MKPKPRLEKYEQQAGVKLLRLLGAQVYVLGTKRRAGDYQGTNQTPGIADVEAWLFLRPHQRRSLVFPRRLLKWEVKRAKVGKLTPEQEAYASLCSEAGIDYVCGPCDALMEWLKAEGLWAA